MSLKHFNSFKIGGKLKIKRLKKNFSSKNP